MTQVCDTCSAQVPENDSFCERCGAALPSPTPAESGSPVPPCPKCNAPAEDIDAEGFCSSCGFRRAERGRDHLEIELGADIGGVTDRGLRHHRNEDYLAAASFGHGQAKILVVCDGVSSVRDAELASATAAERILRALEDSFERSQQISESDLEAALHQAQQAVTAISSADLSDGASPATTAVAAVVQGDEILISWLGDSRAYWVSTGEIRQLTRDHSWLTDATTLEQTTEAEALKDPRAHAITRWLGVGDPEESKPESVSFHAPSPGKLLLCTDGLWNYAPKASTLKALLDPLDGTALSLSRNLVNYARSKGGNDNITAVVCSIENSPPNDSIQG